MDGKTPFDGLQNGGYFMLKTDPKKNSMIIMDCLRGVRGVSAVYMTG